MLGAISVIIQASLPLFLGGMVFAYLLHERDAKWVRERLLPIMIGLFALAMLVPNRWVMYIVLVAILPMLARNRSDIPPLFVVAAVSLPSLLTEIGVGGIYLLDFDKWLMLAIGSAIAFFVHKPAQRDLAWGRFDVPFLMIMALEVVQARGTNFTSMLRLETNILLSYVLPYFIISRSVTKPEDMRRLLLALVFAGFCLSAVAMYESRRAVLLYNILSQRMGIAESISSYSHQRAGMLRATASFPEATSFGCFLCTCFLAAMSLTNVFRSKRLSWVAFAGIFAGIMAANTRAALLGLVVGVLAYDLFKKNYRKLTRNVSIIAVLYLGAVAVAQFSTSMATRLGMAGDAAGTTDYRRVLITRGWQEIRKHPLFGVNPIQAYASLADIRQGEGFVDFVNGYIYFGLTAGITGMIVLLLGFLLMPLKLTMVRRRLNKLPNGREYAASFFAISIYFGVACGTSGFGGRWGMVFYILLAAASALAAMRAPRFNPATFNPSARAPASQDRAVSPYAQTAAGRA